MNNLFASGNWESAVRLGPLANERWLFFESSAAANGPSGASSLFLVHRKASLLGLGDASNLMTTRACRVQDFLVLPN